MLKQSPQQLEHTLATKIIDGGRHKEDNSKFLSFVQRVKSKDDVSRGLNKMRLKFADATHISCGYRLSNPKLCKDQGYEDDGEIGQGRTILNTLRDKDQKETAVYVVRYYGGVHLGRRRFDIAKDLTKSAIRAYKAVRQLAFQRHKSVQRDDLQTSIVEDLSQLSQLSLEDGDSFQQNEAPLASSSLPSSPSKKT